MTATRDPAGDEAVRRCPRCDASTEPLQEYCLECGTRLPLLGRGSGPLRGLFGRAAPGDWLLPVLVTLVVAILAGAAVVAAQRQASADDPYLVVATDVQTAPEETAVETATAPGPTTAPPPATTPRRRPPRRPADALFQWPARASGYTVVLASLPKVGGPQPARAKAREALAAGLPTVGILDSDEFPSLHPGYFVVFSGIYAGFDAARSGVARAQTSGYEAAYARQITR